MLTQARLKELLRYDPDTGIFTRKFARGGAYSGSVAGWSCKGYLRIGIDGEKYRAHRLAWLYINGEFPADQIDHINHKKDDNRIANLREATNTENSRNRPRNYNNSSGIVGVRWHKRDKIWCAQIKVDRKEIHLGYFENISDAIIVRKMAEYEYDYHQNHGE